MKPLGITACLIAKNEEGQIARCLKSLEGVDQIVVHDTGSTDRTVKIARRAGAEVIEGMERKPFHFGDARQVALFAAQFRWVLSVDADEVLLPGMLPALRKLSHRLGISAWNLGYLFRANREGPTRELTLVRFFLADEFGWQYRIHEQALPFRAEIQVGQARSPLFLEHLPALDRRTREGQNLELLELAIVENPEYTMLHRYLGMEYLMRGKYKDAIGPLERYVRESQDPPLEVSEGELNIARCYGKLGRVDSMLSWCRTSARRAPDRREPLYLAAEALMALGRFEEALSFIEEVLAIGIDRKPDFYLNWPTVWSNIPEEALAWCKAEIAKKKERAHASGS